MAKDDLEVLLEQAQREAQNRRRPQQPIVAIRRERITWTDPANWHLQPSQIQLVHREETVDTLVGLFDEYRHARFPTARKLIASTRSAVMNLKVEYVNGDHWLGPVIEYKRQIPDQSIELCEDLVLDMGVSAPAVVVEARLVGGGVSRVILREPTTFEAYTPRTILLLPAGMDILEGLTRGSKERLWTAIKTQIISPAGTSELTESAP